MEQHLKRYLLCRLCTVFVFLLFLTAFSRYRRELCKIAAGEAVTVSGRVCQIETKDTYYGQQTILSLDSAAFCRRDEFSQTSKNFIQPVGMKPFAADGILCYLRTGEESPLIGENICVMGEAEPFLQKRNPGGFDAALYYRTKGITWMVRDAKVIKRGEHYSGMKTLLLRCRESLAESAEAVCGQDAGIMRAMLLGEKKALSREQQKLYQAGGISHILAISGLHISLLGVGLFRLLKGLRIPIGICKILSIALMTLYAVMTGGSPSAWRAVFMFAMGLIAGMLGRSQDRLTSLACSAMLLTLFSPLLPAQSGFLLSFGAILGLELLYPELKRILETAWNAPFLPGSAVFLVTLPVLLTSFYEFPPYSFLLNLLVIPLMSMVAGGGLLAILFGKLSISLAGCLFFPVHLLLSLFAYLCQKSSLLPGGRFITGEPGWIRITAYVMLLLLFYLQRKYMTRPCTLLILAGSIFILVHPLEVGERITALDVGQGDCILLQGEKGAVLIDGGSSSEKELAEYTLLPALKAGAVNRLSCIFLTHTDADHINGIQELLERGREEGILIEKLVLPVLDMPDEAYLEIVKKAQEWEIPVFTMAAGDTLEEADFSFYCLHPQKNRAYADKNAASLVLRAEKGRFSALFMGDIDGEAELEFVREADMQGQVFLLKAGHHGSKVSCSEELLQLCRPEVTLISCGADNSYGHPNQETLRRIRNCGSRVYVTKDCGAVQVQILGKRIRVRCYSGILPLSGNSSVLNG